MTHLPGAGRIHALIAAAVAAGVAAWLWRVYGFASLFLAEAGR